MREIVAIAVGAIALGSVGGAGDRPAQAEKPIRVAMMCMKTREETSGFNKICYYDCLGSEVAINVSSTSLCPLSINR